MKSRLIVAMTALLPALLSGADFPHYRGDGSGAAGESGLELITDISKATLLWDSKEAAAPMGRSLKKEFPGGFGVPIVANGRVYLSIAWPADPKINTTYKGKPEDIQVNADEIIYCFDAETGKTIWKTIHEGTGWNFQAVYPSDGQITPCVAKGRVVMLGTTGRAYCLDAKTGKTLWHKPSGKMALAWELYKKDVLAGKAKAVRGAGTSKQFRKQYVEKVLAPRPPTNPEHGGSGGGGFNSTPRIFGDMAVFNLMGQETVAFDLETGEERWRIGAIAGSSCSVITWTHEGTDYLIGSLGCFDPTTGKKIYGLPNNLGGAYQGSTWAISGDYLVGAIANPNKESGPYKSLKCLEVCYRLSPKGATEVWRHPYFTSYMSPVIYRDHVYLHSKIADYTPLPEHYPKPDFDKMHKGSGEALICIELTTGIVKGIGRGLGGANSQGTSLFAMDGRIFTYGSTMFDTTPTADGTLTKLGQLPDKRSVAQLKKKMGKDFVPPAFVKSMRCTYPTGANGLLYLRPYDDRCLLQCIDLRQHAK